MALSSRCLLNVLNNGTALRTLLSPQYRCVTLAPRKVAPALVETHDERNARLNRPQSPHLTIYRPQVTSMLSITHRMTGLAQSVYVYGIAVTSLASSKQFPQLLEALHGVDPALIYTGKLVLAFPFAYHFVNGIRHLVWDSGNALTLKGVYTTGYAMLAASGVLTIVLCAL